MTRRYLRRHREVDVENQLAVLTLATNFNWMNAVAFGTGSEQSDDERPAKGRLLTLRHPDRIPEATQDVHQALPLFGGVGEQGRD